MGDSSHRPTPPRSRMRNSGGGEIVEVQGGHIVRSTGRKDRHSKVCTAKGPRDRRVRLAAHTAIQFYDVQDRLGYDRPSKAVDWLIKKAKNAIDELAQLPAWHPTLYPQQEAAPKELDNDADVQNSSFLPPSLDSDAIADTIKSFFPTGGASAESSFPTPGSNSQDLRLSLQSFQDPILLQNPTHSEPQVLLSWPEHHHQVAELSCYQRLSAWSGGGDTVQPMLIGQNQFVSQRGPLQSSNTPSIRAWMDHHPPILPIYPSSFAGFHIPARIQGDEEEHGGYSDKPSSASSQFRH